MTPAQIRHGGADLETWTGASKASRRTVWSAWPGWFCGAGHRLAIVLSGWVRVSVVSSAVELGG